MPVGQIVEVEEGFNRDLDDEKRIDIEVDGKADRERSATEIQIDYREERAFGVGVFEFGDNRQQLGLHHEQQARAGKLK